MAKNSPPLGPPPRINKYEPDVQRIEKRRNELLDEERAVEITIVAKRKDVEEAEHEAKRRRTELKQEEKKLKNLHDNVAQLTDAVAGARAVENALALLDGQKPAWVPKRRSKGRGKGNAQSEQVRNAQPEGEKKKGGKKKTGPHEVQWHNGQAMMKPEQRAKMEHKIKREHHSDAPYHTHEIVEDVPQTRA